MGTQPTPTPAPAQPATSKLASILAIINAALQGLTLIPAVSAPAGVALAFETILKNALAAYQAEAGQPIDLTKIPLESPVQ